MNLLFEMPVQKFATAKVKCVNYLLCLRACNLQKNNHLCLFVRKLVERCVLVCFLFLLNSKRCNPFSFPHMFWPIKFWRAAARKHFWIFEYSLFFLIFVSPPLDRIIAFWICEPYNGNVNNKSIDRDTWWEWIMIYRLWFPQLGHFEPLSGL